MQDGPSQKEDAWAYLLERPLYGAPLPLVANNWPALNDPKAPVANRQPIGGSTLKAVGHATHRETLVPRQRSLIESGGEGPALSSDRKRMSVRIPGQMTTWGWSRSIRTPVRRMTVAAGTGGYCTARSPVA